MFLNYLKIAIRLFTRNKLVSTINISGLALALAGSLLIGIFIHDELSYDRSHENADRIFRVTRNFLSPDGSVSLHLGLIAPPFGPLLKNDFSDVIESARIFRFYQSLSREENGESRKHLNIENVYYADPSVFKIFTIPIVAGDSKTALEKPYTMLISEAAAMKYFGTLDVIGEQIKADKVFLEIVGVFKDFVKQTHWHADALISFSTLNDDAVYSRERLEGRSWGNNTFSTYILVNNDFDPDRTASQFPAFLDKHMGEKGNPELPHTWTNLFLQPLTSIHLHSHLDFELEANGNINQLYTMGAIGIFLILIACFNFINLSTARATTRGKEVGLRKVVGAFKKQLITQHLSESILTAFLALILAVAIVTMAIPWLNDFTNKSIQFSDYVNVSTTLVVLAFIVVIGMIAGLYPAFIISGFKPSLILKGRAGSVKGAGNIRKVLVVLQFSISIIMIIATLVTYQQLTFLNNQELGYAKNQVVTIDYDEQLMERFEAFHDELTKNPAVINATRSSLVPTDRLLAYQGTWVEKGDSLVPTEISMKDVSVDPNFFDTYQVPILSGRNFSREIKTDDSLAFVINESAARMVGWSNEEAVGKALKNGSVKGTVVGVVKDFHFESLHEPIVPVVFHGQKRFYRISVQISKANIKEALARLEEVWGRFVSNRPFQYSFLNERYQYLYTSEKNQNELFIIFAGLAIFIASMGLFGLATFNTLQRSKEVCIRKVLGAPVASILQLLGTEIFILVLISNAVAWPLAWYFMHEWLSEFAYHVDMNVMTYLAAAAVALVITALTIGSQTLKAAHVNPATILRNE
jgi:putative ABC transport system permease protein